VAEPPRKRRTREHVIADLSVNHVERFVLRQGHVAERILSDYGYDLNVTTFDQDGEREPGLLFVQLKATDSLREVEGGQAAALTLDRRDLHLWREEVFPVILTLYDAVSDCAYWLHIQGWLEARVLPAEQGTITARIPKGNLVSEASVADFRRLKNEALARVREVTHGGDG
jgi:hypothetical protein